MMSRYLLMIKMNIVLKFQLNKTKLSYAKKERGAVAN